MTRARRVAIALAVCTIAASSCASDRIPRDVAAPLGAQVDQIEQLASAGDYAGAREHAGELRSLVSELRDRGRVDAASASRVLTAVSAVETALDETVRAAALASPQATGTSADSSRPTVTVAPVVTTTKAPVTTTTAKRPKDSKGKGKNGD